MHFYNHLVVQTVNGIYSEPTKPTLPDEFNSYNNIIIYFIQKNTMFTNYDCFRILLALLFR